MRTGLYQYAMACGAWLRHELSTRFVIPAGKPGVRAPQQRGDKHAASAEAVGERERPTSPVLNLAASLFVCGE